MTTIAAEKPSSEAGGVEDLEALFESIAMQIQVEQAGAGTPRLETANNAVLCPEAVRTPSGSDAPDAEGDAAERLISRVGQLTRVLHDSLRELGLDQLIARAAEAIPDARDRLNYVAVMTQQAADRVLNATDLAKPVQDKLESGATELSHRWKALFDRKLGIEEFKGLVQDTRAYLDEVPSQTGITNAQLMEIMMAQNFQDLTGQVIKKIMDVVHTMEQQLIQLLVENIPAAKRSELDGNLLNGPQISIEGRTDLVTNQSQVDDLLEGLGF